MVDTMSLLLPAHWVQALHWLATFQLKPIEHLHLHRIKCRYSFENATGLGFLGVAESYWGIETPDWSAYRHPESKLSFS